jgi:hypothetical protein
MKFTLWDQLVLNLTGRLPKKTQAEVDALVQLKQFIARATEADHKARLAAEEKKKSPKPKDSTLDLVKDDTSLSPPKKKATPKTKKPSKG